MGTRGLVGFWFDRKKMIGAYNHFDSYPTGLGAQVLKTVRGLDLEILKAKVSSLTFVNSDDKPTEKERKYYEVLGGTNSSVSSGEDWYSTLRNYQGAETITAIMSGEMKHYVDSSDFIQDSLFCEWAYLIDMKKRKVEVWQGFQKTPWAENPFGIKKDENGYYPCKKILTISIDAINEFDDAQIDFMCETIYDGINQADDLAYHRENGIMKKYEKPENYIGGKWKKIVKELLDNATADKSVAV